MFKIIFPTMSQSYKNQGTVNCLFHFYHQFQHLSNFYLKLKNREILPRQGRRGLRKSWKCQPYALFCWCPSLSNLVSVITLLNKSLYYLESILILCFLMSQYQTQFDQSQYHFPGLALFTLLNPTTRPCSLRRLGREEASDCASSSKRRSPAMLSNTFELKSMILIEQENLLTV